MIGLLLTYKHISSSSCPASFLLDGRAVTDDYYESAAREKLEQAGKAHTLGQVLPEEDTRTPAERRRETDRERDRTRRPPDSVSTTLYDLHGTAITTTFGDNGASPFMRSLNWPARRLQQARADLTEENWMLEMARNVQGMNAELTENRRERLMKFTDPVEGHSPRPSLTAPNGLAGTSTPAPAPAPALVKEDQMDLDGPSASLAATPALNTAAHTDSNDPAMTSEQDTSMAAGDGDVDDGASGSSEADTSTRSGSGGGIPERYRDLYNPHAPPVGLYEPTTNLPHFPQSTQPKRARIEHVARRPRLLLPEHGDEHEQDADLDAGETGGFPAKRGKTEHERPILLGSKFGSGATGLATFSTEVEVGKKAVAYGAVRLPADLQGGEAD